MICDDVEGGFVDASEGCVWSRDGAEKSLEIGQKYIA